MERHTSSTKGNLYFAFGSNLSTTQMTQRCPGSALPLAVAKLDNYCWMICERGYANIIPMPPVQTSQATDATTVWGLIYLLTPQDEASLDGYEGWVEPSSGGPNPSVSEKTYKPMLQGNCSYNKLYLLVRVDRWFVDRSARIHSHGIIDEVPAAAANHNVIRTLVYVDEVRQKPGRIMSEYIPRMSRAVKESIPLGIPEIWVERTMRQHGIVWWLGDTAGQRARGDGHWSNEDFPEGEWEALREHQLLSQQ